MQAAPAADVCYVFTRWTGSINSTDPTVTITVRGPTGIRAEFDHDGTSRTLTVRVTPIGSGMTTGSGTYDCGDRVEATATADSANHWYFERWEPDRFGTSSPVFVRMTVTGWIRAHFARDVVSSGSFTVTGSGSTQAAATIDALSQVASEAARVGADRHWQTSLTHGTTTTVSYISFAEVRWEITGTAHGTSGRFSTQAAVDAAIRDANEGVPAGATVTGTTTDSFYYSLTGFTGWFAEAYVSWRDPGASVGSGSGSTAAGAELAAFADARTYVPSNASITGSSYLTQRQDETIHTATADYSWESYSRQRAASESGSSTGDEDGRPPEEPELY